MLSRIVCCVCCAVLVTAACSTDATRFREEEPVEDCAVAGDEDGNDLSDCADPTCADVPACAAARCTPEVCDGLDNDCNGTADDNEALGTASSCAAASCLALLSANPAAINGPQWIAFGDNRLRVHCDMTGGGWTLVMNQVPGADLPDDQQTVNLNGLGTLDQSYRLGGTSITSIRPTSAWKLTDEDNSAYFSRDCVVDWSINDLDRAASPCTIGYPTEQLLTPYNGGHINVSTRGIGINNSSRFCSIRAYNTQTPTSFEPGPASTCRYTRDRIVRLWYR